MDILSEVLNVVRLNGGAFFTAEFRSPWAVYTPSAEEVARILDTPAESVAVFHVFVEGECWISLDDTEPFALTAGSAIIFSHSPSHQLASGQGMMPEPIIRLVRSSETNWLPVINHGGGGPITRLFCGYLQCDHRFNPLVGALPALIIATPDGRNVGPRSAGRGVEEPVETAHEAGGPPCCVAVPAGDVRLRRTLDHLVDEAFESRPGAPAMLPRLIELFYVEVLRRYVTAASLTGKGWFAAMNDDVVGRALRALHAEPAHKWTVDALAAHVGLSRSALAQRFTELVGEPPIRYLTTWRMQKAKGLMRRGDLTLSQIAELVGYDSDVAFHRAFRREIGTPPGAWRRATAS